MRREGAIRRGGSEREGQRLAVWVGCQVGGHASASGDGGPFQGYLKEIRDSL